MSHSERDARPYRPIADYALIGDCHGVALVARDGSIDWGCLPRIDSGSCFGRLLDRARGGFCAIEVADGEGIGGRAYLDDTMVLRSVVTSSAGQAHLTDLMAIDPQEPRRPRRQLLRILEGVRGTVEVAIRVAPRFDYGGSSPWLRRMNVQRVAAFGGDDALDIQCDAPLELDGDHDVVAHCVVRAGERLRLSIAYVEASILDDEPPPELHPEQLDQRERETIAFWRAWADGIRVEGPDAPGAVRSALVLKALGNVRTGAIAAAATTSLPEARRGGRTWDYRYTWVRDSVFAARALGELALDAEADAFRRFIQRSSAGHADELRIAYGVGGERRLVETEVPELEGWEGIGPVRVGNQAAKQEQHDVYGELVNLTWRWHKRGHSPDDDLWRFVRNLVDAAAERWRQPDRGIWEWRGGPRHFTHSKVMCWSALERGIQLAQECDRTAPLRRWRQARDEVRAAIERHGYDRGRGVFTQVFDRGELDAALLLLPVAGFVDWDDERMVRTADAIREQLGERGLIRRYAVRDGLKGREGAFLACSFWLSECLARQGRAEDARAVFDAALAAGNDLGLFSEELDVRRRAMMGNFPQALTHLAHISAVLALGEASRSSR
ncbi:MAG TPA: glycoside hydrolase family 15 protein [Conexibacter sp.]|nr:glycoside hydrolase family 15 protein [Conexibacter sp.]